MRGNRLESEKHMLKSKLKWSVLLLLTALVLLWRVTDFALEAAGGGFHMTRGGLAIWGAEAEVIELVIILAGIILVWKAVANLIRLHLIR